MQERFVSAVHKFRVGAIVIANIVLAAITIAERFCSAESSTAISSQKDVAPDAAPVGGLRSLQYDRLRARSREADRLAHGRTRFALTEAFGRIVSMPLSWHSQRGTSNALHTLLRACETLFGLWLEFMRQHLATAVRSSFSFRPPLPWTSRLSLILVRARCCLCDDQQVVMSRTKEGQAAVEGHYHTVFSHVSDSISKFRWFTATTASKLKRASLKKFTQRLAVGQYRCSTGGALASGLNRIASTISMMAILVIGTVLVQRGELGVGEVIGFHRLRQSADRPPRPDEGLRHADLRARAKLEDFFQLEDSVQDREEPPDAGELKGVVGEVRIQGHFLRLRKLRPRRAQRLVQGQGRPDDRHRRPDRCREDTLVNAPAAGPRAEHGQILIDGVDIATVTRKSLRRSIATVFQDAGLMNPLDRRKYPPRP